MKLLLELGTLALGTRFSMAADRLFDEVRKIYSSDEIDFDPRNFLLFQSLAHQKESSVSSLAADMNCTHARASQKLAELTKQKLVEPVASSDSRKSCFRLSAKGNEVFSQLLPIWKCIEQSLREDFEADDLLARIKKFDEQMDTEGLSQRVISRLALKNQMRKKVDELAFKVLEPDFDKKVQADFQRLNQAWLKEFKFEIEAADREVLFNLSSYVRENSGLLIVAEREGKAIGTALLTRMDKKTFELSKFCVDKKEQGRGIGKRLLAISETEARMRGAKKLFLETNSKLEAAVKLYRSAGFVSKPVKQSAYIRVNLEMTKRL